MCQVLSLLHPSCGHAFRYHLSNPCSAGFSHSARSCKGEGNEIVATRPYSKQGTCEICRNDDDDDSEILQQAGGVSVSGVRGQEGWEGFCLAETWQEASGRKNVNLFMQLRQAQERGEGGAFRWSYSGDEVSEDEDTDVCSEDEWTSSEGSLEGDDESDFDSDESSEEIVWREINWQGRDSQSDDESIDNSETGSPEEIKWRAIQWQEPHHECDNENEERQLVARASTDSEFLRRPSILRRSTGDSTNCGDPFRHVHFANKVRTRSFFRGSISTDYEDDTAATEADVEDNCEDSEDECEEAFFSPEDEYSPSWTDGESDDDIL
ncbi:hypothetical protein ACLMJK_008469 [Lecanora helva]